MEVDGSDDFPDFNWQGDFRLPSRPLRPGPGARPFLHAQRRRLAEGPKVLRRGIPELAILSGVAILSALRPRNLAIPIKKGLRSMGL